MFVADTAIFTSLLLYETISLFGPLRLAFSIWMVFVSIFIPHFHFARIKINWTTACAVYNSKLHKFVVVVCYVLLCEVARISFSCFWRTVILVSVFVCTAISKFLVHNAHSYHMFAWGAFNGFHSYWLPSPISIGLRWYHISFAIIILWFEVSFET